MNTNEIVTKRIRVPRVTEAQLLAAFERMCGACSVVSRGFDVDKIDGPNQWAMKKTKGYGWMVVCGLGGCGCALSRSSGYVQTRWNFLMLIEAVMWGVQTQKRSA